MNVDTAEFAAITGEAEALRDENDGLRRAVRRVFRYGLEAGMMAAAAEPPPPPRPRRRDHLTIVR